ncbi:sugar ABC transporter permease [Diplocloster hominis]|uniref:carbohydrate ABC transporter permease n=1 Tax=Diplocloster hominis TaxID=3079010 RepID=UPI0031BAB4CA
MKLKRLWNRASSTGSILNVLYMPALLLVFMFIFYPFVQGILISFREWNGYSPNYLFVGLEKYKAMFKDPNFYTVLRNTLIYGIGSTFLQNVFGLLMALLLDQKLRGEKFVRTLVYLPVVVSAIIMGYVWYFFFKYNGGAINDVTALFGAQPVDWLSSGKRSVPIIVLVNTFQYVGSSMMIYLAGLQNISTEYFEAAEIDGASGYKKFFKITLPLLMPSITFSVVWNLIGGLKLFDVIQALTGGGPGYASASISTMMYQVYFVRMDAGYAAAMGNFMFVLISVLSIYALRYLRGKEVEQ